MESASDASYGSHLSPAPTTVRRRVLLVTFVSAVLLYLDRYCMNFAQRYVKEDLALTDAQVDACVAAFFLAYGLAQVPAGGLTDRFGSRSMLAIYILAWSFFTAAMGWVGGFIGLLAVRLAAGVSQAGAYPTGARVVGQWAPLASRGLANSIVALGGRFGGALAPPLTAALVVAFVPLSTSPLLTTDDILDLNSLSFQLQEAVTLEKDQRRSGADDGGAAVSVVRRIAEDIKKRSHLGEGDGAARRMMDMLRLRTKLESSTRERSDSARLDESAFHAAFRDAATVEFNHFIQHGLDLRAAEVQQLRLESEAEALLNRRDLLTEPERERLHRLVLEAVFPDSIRKLYVHGWRPVMFWYGLIGILVAGWFYWQVRDRPDQHPRVNAAELSLIASGSPTAHARGTANSVPWMAIVGSRTLWMLSITAFGTTFGWTFLVSLLDRYLDTVHRVPFVERGWMQSIPLTIGWLGMGFGGWWTDRLARRRGVRFGRAFPIAFSRFIAAAAFAFMLLHPSPWVCIALMALIAFGTDLGSPAIWSVSQDIGGRSVAAILGWGNMWGNLGGFAAPVTLGWVSREWSWTAAFALCAASFLIAGVAALLIDASRPVEPLTSTANDTL